MNDATVLMKFGHLTIDSIEKTMDPRVFRLKMLNNEVGNIMADDFEGIWGVGRRGEKR
ncbi:MAG: hypothetical protein LBR80_07180 [Deltaproteobacteria bacterium]|jgi:hypothetical protein|nr:hypothetical protein [Deltaproteobacteria bacterium]